MATVPEERFDDILSVQLKNANSSSSHIREVICRTKTHSYT